MNRLHNASDLSVYEKRVKDGKGLNHSAKLTIAKVREIRKLAADNPRIKNIEIAQQYNVARKTIGSILRGETWRDV